MMERLQKAEIVKMNPDDKDLLEDVIIENKQAIEMSNVYSNILSGMMDAFKCCNEIPDGSYNNFDDSNIDSKYIWYECRVTVSRFPACFSYNSWYFTYSVSNRCIDLYKEKMVLIMFYMAWNIYYGC